MRGDCHYCPADVSYWKADDGRYLLVEPDENGPIVIVRRPRARWEEYVAHVVTDGEAPPENAQPRMGRFRIHECPPAEELDCGA